MGVGLGQDAEERQRGSDASPERVALDELGYRVDVVEDGEQALAHWGAAAEAGRGYDVVIMDLTVPGGMGGKEAMAELRRRHPEAIGIVVSGYSKDPVMSNYEEAGFAASLSKPFDLASLGKLLARLLAGQQRPRRVDADSVQGSA